MTSKQDRQTRHIEMVETHNIALSLMRLKNATSYASEGSWKRALYHALSMAYCGSFEEQRLIREALKLP